MSCLIDPSYPIGPCCAIEEDYYRSDEGDIKRILTSRWPYTLVVGLRRMGKTSFLRRLERAANQGDLFDLKNRKVRIEFETEFLPIYFSFHYNMSNWHRYVKKIIGAEFDRLASTIPNRGDDFVFWLKACHQKAKRDGKVLLALLDEAEELFDVSMKHRLRALSDYLQEKFSYPNTTGLYVVLAASPSIFQLKDKRRLYKVGGINKRISAFEKTYELFESQTVSIKPLSDEEAIALISRSKDAYPVRKRRSKIIDEIIGFAGSHPMVLQAVSMECLLGGNKYRRLAFDNRQELVEKAYQRLKEQYCASFFRTGLTDVQRALFISVHQGSIATEEDCNPRYQLQLEELTRYGAFIKEASGLRLENQFLGMWFERDNTAKKWSRSKKGSELMEAVRAVGIAEIDPSLILDYNPDVLPKPKLTGQRFIIHHISDIHVGGSYSLINNKDWQGSALADMLKIPPMREYIYYLDGNLEQCPHVLIVSGDLGTTGSKDELHSAVSFVKEICENHMQELGSLHWSRRCIIVPGNHDVQWIEKPSRKVREDKFKLFKTETKDFITPFAKPISDGRYIPFLVIPDIPLLVYGFNSSMGGGEFLPLLEKIRSEFRKIVASKKSDAEELRSKIRELARIDAAFVDEADLRIFRGWHTKWGESEESHYEEYVKIAVCHHHLSHFPITEIKKFESVINAGRIKQTLLGCDFDVVLHGHKHLSKGFYEEFLGDYQRGLHIISAGTLSNWPAEGFPEFNQIEISCDSKDVYKCEVFAVELKDGRYTRNNMPSYVLSRYGHR